MPYLCKKCGNKTDFFEDGDEVAEVKEWRSARRDLDENGEETDYESFDVTDSETNDTSFEVNGEGVMCSTCEENVDDVSQEEWDNWIEGEGEDNQEPPEPRSNKLENVKEKLLRRL